MVIDHGDICSDHRGLRYSSWHQVGRKWRSHLRTVERTSDDIEAGDNFVPVG
jgi:hypothetical protein